MTKITLTIELEIPNVENWTDGELSQLIFDEYINHATCSHYEDATHWMAESGKREKEGKDTFAANQIAKMHQTWGEICSKAKWLWKKV